MEYDEMVEEYVEHRKVIPQSEFDEIEQQRAEADSDDDAETAAKFFLQ